MAKTADCKSVTEKQRRFDSYLTHFNALSPSGKVHDSDSCICKFKSCKGTYLDVGQFGSPLDLGSRRCRFKSCHPDWS